MGHYFPHVFQESQIQMDHLQIVSFSGIFENNLRDSVQTLATIGYGHLYPISLGSQVIVTVESFVGMLITAVFTGMLFAKFSKTTAKVKFSKVAVITTRNGKLTNPLKIGTPCLRIRIANKRTAQIISAAAKLTMVTTEYPKKDKTTRVVKDLNLLREKNHVFGLTWYLIFAMLNQLGTSCT